MGYTLALAGAAAKLVGALSTESKSLLVDALTCIANAVAGAVAVRYTFEASRPPDADHPYGHERVALLGVVVTLITYSFVAGLVIAELLDVEEYTLAPHAPLYAALGLGLYAASVAALRGVSYVLTVYSTLTLTELVESAVTLIATAGGVLFGYLVDYAGALVLTGFLAYELVSRLREVSGALSDYAPPDMIRRVSSFIESRYGVEVCSLRLRTFAPGVLYGDAVVAVPASSLERAHELVDAMVEELRARFGVNIVVHYEPAPCDR